MAVWMVLAKAESSVVLMADETDMMMVVKLVGCLEVMKVDQLVELKVDNLDKQTVALMVCVKVGRLVVLTVETTVGTMVEVKVLSKAELMVPLMVVKMVDG